MLIHILPLLYTIRPNMVYQLVLDRMSRIIPLNTLLGIQLDAVEDGVGRTCLPYRGDILNHIGTIHAAAIYGLAEAASGCAMAGALAPMIAQIRPVAASARITYLKPAKATLTAVAHTVDAPSVLRETLKQQNKTCFDVHVIVTDASGEQVAAIVVEWHVSLRR